MKTQISAVFFRYHNGIDHFTQSGKKNKILNTILLLE